MRKEFIEKKLGHPWSYWYDHVHLKVFPSFSRMSTWGLRKTTSLNRSADREIENHIGASGRTGSLAPPINISIKQTITNSKFGSSIYRFDDIPLKGIISLHSTNTCGIALVPITLALLLCNDMSRIGLTSKASRLFTRTFRWLSSKRFSLKSWKKILIISHEVMVVQWFIILHVEDQWVLDYREGDESPKWTFLATLHWQPAERNLVLLKYTEHGKLPKLLSVICTVITCKMSI